MRLRNFSGTGEKPMFETRDSKALEFMTLLYQLKKTLVVGGGKNCLQTGLKNFRLYDLFKLAFFTYLCYYLAVLSI